MKQARVWRQAFKGKRDSTFFELHSTEGRKAGAMIHFSCDRCKRVIDLEQELRYVVRMEIEAVMDPVHEGEPQDDRDHLLEIDEILERVDASDNGDVGEEIYQKRRYDLCTQCYRRFSSNPLGREKKPLTTFGFSHN